MLNLITNVLKKAGISIPFLALLTFVLLCFAPPIPITPELYFKAEDLLLPFVILAILPQIKLLKYWYFILLIIWSVYGVITMAINGRLGVINDYTEIYKLLKFSFYTILFYIYFAQTKEFFKPVTIVFLGLIAFNFLHYYNIFHFNENVMIPYATNPLHLEFFGKNSLGGPDTKRIIGTMGNPNINAIFLALFSIFYMPYLKRKEWHSGKLLFYIAVGLIFLTQSRTCVVAFIVFFLVFILMNRLKIKQTLKISFLILVTIVLVKFADQYSLNYFSNAKFSTIENKSLKGRLDVWHELGLMIKEKPISGYGINKNYFYNNNLFSENEYILMAWRYGIIGLFFYLSMLFGLLVYYRKELIKNRSNLNIGYIQIVLLYSLNALMNNPISDPALLVLFAISTGAFLSQFPLNEKIKNV